MAEAVRHHYAKLLDPVRLEGLWNWRQVAVALHGAGIGVHSGTVPVERLWASLKTMIPPAARRMLPHGFDLLAKLAYFRHNNRHFHSKATPLWTEEDTLLAERLDDLRATLYPGPAEDQCAPAPDACT